MAYDSELKDGSDLNEVKIPEACGNEGLSVSPDFHVEFGGGDGCKDDNELRALFDQVLLYFLKEVSANKDVCRPFPPKLGDGKDADLFKLFLAVRRVGSYELVSKNEMWEFVAKECGLEIKLVASLKLIYVKYLKALDQWLSKSGFEDKKMEHVDIGVIETLGFLSSGLEGYICSNRDDKSISEHKIVGFKDDNKGKCVGMALSDGGGMLGGKKNEDTLEFNRNGGGTNLDMAKSRMLYSMVNGGDKEFRVDGEKRHGLSPESVVKKVGVSMINDDDKRSESLPDNVVKKVGFAAIDDDDDEEGSVENNKQIELSIKNVVDEVLRFHSYSDINVVSHNDNDVKNVIGSQKRKREKESSSLSEMLDWVANVARDPHDLTIGTSHRSFKWKSHTSEKLWNQALLARRALFAKLSVDPGNEACGSRKKNQRMHPAMYDHDRAQLQDHVSSEGTRCSQRTTSAKPCSCRKCTTRSSSRTKRNRTEPGKHLMDEVSETFGAEDNGYNLGTHYQVEVPAWTGIVYESDPKWLGTQMWPPLDDHDGKHGKGPAGIEPGTQISCECVFRGSAECVRFHVAENRLKIKLELGPLFYKWKFNQMGEEVSLSWEPEEEKLFRRIVLRARHELTNSNKSRHEIMDRFWRRALDSLPDKPKQKLVSYYFNVFVLRRRSYQNRVTPSDINSDNDEEEVGSAGDRFGYEKIHGLSLNCSKNMQCKDLES